MLKYYKILSDFVNVSAYVLVNQLQSAVMPRYYKTSKEHEIKKQILHCQ